VAIGDRSERNSGRRRDGGALTMCAAADQGCVPGAVFSCLDSEAQAVKRLALLTAFTVPPARTAACRGTTRRRQLHVTSAKVSDHLAPLIYAPAQVAGLEQMRQ
jgi:hypothetical protein